MSTIGERIKKVRTAKGLTQSKFCDQIGLKRNSLSLIESGDRNTSNQTILSICREFGVNEEWLRTGEGEMFAPAPTSALDALVKERGLPRQDGFVIEQYLELSDATRAEIRKFILNLADNLRAQAAAEKQQPAPEPAPAPAVDPSKWDPERAALHAELDRQLDEEERLKRQGS